MSRLTRKEAIATQDQRCLAFLRDVYKQITKGDDMPRMIYTAMTHRLGWYHVNAACTLRLVEKDGWRWKWIAGAPHEGMATALKEEVAHRIERGATVPLFRRPKIRNRYRQLIAGGKTA